MMLHESLRPSKVYFEVSNICNFKCDFCPINQSERKKMQMDFSLYKKGINDIIKDHITDTVCFHILGEPMLYPSIFDALHYAKASGLKTDMTTNGSHLTEDKVNRLIAAQVTKLNISIETIDEKEHAARGSDISFSEYYNRIIQATKLIHESDANMNIELCLMNTETRKFFDIDKSMRLNWNKNIFKSKLIKLIFDICCAMDKPLSMEEIESRLKNIKLNRPKLIRIDDHITIYVQLFADWGNAFTSKKVHSPKIGCCGYGFTNIGILNSGEVTICCVDYDGKTSLGNLKDDSLASILTSENAMNLRKGFKRMRLVHPYCQKCFGSTNSVKAIIKGLLSIYLFGFLKFQPATVKEVRII